VRNLFDARDLDVIVFSVLPSLVTTLDSKFRNFHKPLFNFNLCFQATYQASPQSPLVSASNDQKLPSLINLENR
jgi:hypothetical protein